MNCHKCGKEYKGPVCPKCGEQEPITAEDIERIDSEIKKMEIISNNYVPREPSRRERRAEKQHLKAQKQIQKALKKNLKSEQKLSKAQSKLKKTQEKLDKSKM